MLAIGCLFSYFKWNSFIADFLILFIDYLKIKPFLHVHFFITFRCRPPTPLFIFKTCTLVMTLFGCCVNGAHSSAGGCSCSCSCLCLWLGFFLYCSADVPPPSHHLTLPHNHSTSTCSPCRQRKLKAHFKIFHTWKLFCFEQVSYSRFPDSWLDSGGG